MSTLNRVWDPTAGALVTWRTQSPDAIGAEYPGPDAFANTSDFTVVRDTQQASPLDAEPLDLRHAPEGLWWLDGDRTDKSGNGITLAVGHGIEQYGPGPVPGRRAAYFNATTIFDRASHDAPLLLLGDATFEALVYPISYPTFQIIFGFEETEIGSLEANNTAYVWYLNSTGNPGYTHHNGARNLNNFEWTSTVIPLFAWTHLAMVRDDTAKTVTLYINGYADATVYTYTNSPTGGTNSKLEIGGDSFSSGSPSVMWDGFISTPKISPAILTAAQVLANARIALPPGMRP